MRRGSLYQITLIALGLLATALLAIFFYRELFPEYKIYQEDYIALEKFHAEETGEDAPPFKIGIKQIVLERKDHGPAAIDRCTSCHVALDVPYFSPTKIAYNDEGRPILDENGIPKKVPNENYIFKRLDEKIKFLTDAEVNDRLDKEGSFGKVQKRLEEAERLKSLKIARVGSKVYDVSKVLAAHPLIGKETRPFEYHPINDYGCTACHSGNGRGLTTEKAHGPIFDGDYAAEDEGPEPVFLEEDPANDPLFAKMFNHKPGSSYLFQTTPLLMGSLMEAKCVNCHKSDEKSLENVQMLFDGKLSSSSSSEVNTLTKHYQQGLSLFISQSCYACHRIAGLARGGIGPDLTEIANSYPWYIKQSIVWPQADLKTSTMPNMHLDHEEVQDLMTFLLAQKGESKALEGIPYKLAIEKWEKGAKLPWEKPITPLEKQSIRFGMTIFATEGCAACHRLDGFESNTGFTIEKENPGFDALYDEHLWFSALFPEDIKGSEIVSKLEKYKEEIDKRISEDVRRHSILEEIETLSPFLLESFYSNFQYASRAKNDEYHRLIRNQADPEKKQKLQESLDKWKKRVRNVLMMFIQEYGLGRLIGPKPSWSGIFRSDEWLIGHFQNPGAYTPRSIMPVFPFDDTKFEALTHMLNVLAIQNRDKQNKVWDRFGFDPELAAHIYCSQCHGEFLLGNGPVSEWIYPIPKNLKNPEFLKNLGKDKVIESIMLGVNGTPMPPWGKVADGKESFGSPVLTKENIDQLADWLFSFFAETSNEKQTPKWEYSPENFLQELERERQPLKQSTSRERKAPAGLAFAEPSQSQGAENPSPEILDVFNVVKSPLYPSGEGFLIKKSFYTKENIEEGKAFFELNCAVCHGNEAEGSGARAGFMQEAKPRMLTNLNWIATRDDLRLLQSIKFGVPGTSMTPWGDQTTALQRLQLVVFIRTLSNLAEKNKRLAEVLYQAYAGSLNAVEKARTEEFKQLKQLDEKLKKNQADEKAAIEGSVNENGSKEDALNLYKENLSLLSDLKKQKAIDQYYLELTRLLKEQSGLYREVGKQLIEKNIDNDLLNVYFEIILLDKNRLTFKEDRLAVEKNPGNEQQRFALTGKIAESINALIAAQTEDKVIAEGKLASAKIKEQVAKLEANIHGLTLLKNLFDENMDKISALKKEEAEILAALHQILNNQGN